MYIQSNIIEIHLHTYIYMVRLETDGQTLILTPTYKGIYVQIPRG